MNEEEKKIAALLLHGIADAGDADTRSVAVNCYSEFMRGVALRLDIEKESAK